MTSLSVVAPAKINIVLNVEGRRANGYHDLHMIMVPLSLADHLTIKEIDPCLPAGRGGVELHCDGMSDAGMCSEKNLAWRAAKKFQEATGIEKGIRISLTKSIPIAAGLGGGSSDAAAVLRGLNLLWKCGMTSQELAAIGVQLGADVPFFCYEKTSLVEGIGDRVTPLPSFPKLFLLLVNPGIAVSTADVYRRWDNCHPERSEGSPEFPLEILRSAQNDTFSKPTERSRGRRLGFGAVEGAGCRLEEILPLLHNDLESVTIPMHPEIGEIKNLLKKEGAEGVLMSGSGPTVFGIFADHVSRDRATENVKALTNPSWKVIATESM